MSRPVPLPTRCTIHQLDCALVLGTDPCSCGAQPYETSRCAECGRSDLQVDAMYLVDRSRKVCSDCLREPGIKDTTQPTARSTPPR